MTAIVLPFRTKEISFVVEGLPAPQGSKSAFRSGSRIVVVESAAAAVKAWRAAVKAAACGARGFASARLAVEVRIVFTMPAPDRLPGDRWAPSVRPDIDKLARSTLDGLTDAQVIADDGQVVSLNVRETYPLGSPYSLPDALAHPGALIEIALLSPLRKEITQ
ncbi:RusA family crossover junction endodeoxyribonuclease [Allokutzneria sp. A3M-2-11 16]|uniref:RusA family crossover junction endodeoxyribonuclease n=1 Tax=Allokutzneria sp. A3M-2-11 16 TaxID=2962043 RepID=UPI0020B75800|nr:RusA family crossover junction endodeoxyribonuclease [Allokutzneria sp. A3M-2-11 16]MCP3800342.1 RusA family crossover junction endodeoxyribonuclease [Allokutzneria sp. A3M-2-11 16]